MGVCNFQETKKYLFYFKNEYRVFNTYFLNLNQSKSTDYQ